MWSDDPGDVVAVKCDMFLLLYRVRDQTRPTADVVPEADGGLQERDGDRPDLLLAERPGPLRLDP